MILTLDDFYLSISDKNKIINWIDNFNNINFQNIPLVITGRSGCGKTELINIILKEYTIIYINILINKNIPEYINSVLYKKDISKWFTKNTKEYKSLLFDNLYCSDKSYIREINTILSNIKTIKNPIVITSTDIYNKKLKFIYSKSIHIHIDYSNLEFNNIVRKILPYKPINIINEIIKKSNKNLNSVKVNEIYIKDLSYLKLNSVDNNSNQDICFLTESLIYKDSIKNLYIKYSSDYSIIGLNILENIHTSYSCKNIGALCNIYKSMCIFDLHEQFKSRNCIFHNINYSLLYSIIIPYYYIHTTNLKLNKNIVYNSYISKSLIYTHHNILEEYSNNQYIYYNILLKLIYSIHNNKNKQKIIEIYNKYKCNYKVFNYYTKLANLIYTKNISKNMLLEFNKLVK